MAHLSMPAIPCDETRSHPPIQDSNMAAREIELERNGLFLGMVGIIALTILIIALVAALVLIVVVRMRNSESAGHMTATSVMANDCDLLQRETEELQKSIAAKGAMLQEIRLQVASLEFDLQQITKETDL